MKKGKGKQSKHRSQLTVGCCSAVDRLMLRKTTLKLVVCVRVKLNLLYLHAALELCLVLLTVAHLAVAG